jgi:hypothetical protein
MRAELQRLKRDRDSGRSRAVATELPASVISSGPAAVTSPPVSSGAVPAASSGTAQTVASGSAPSIPISFAHRWKLGAGVAVLIALGAAAGTWFYRHRAITLTDKDSILLADFVNSPCSGSRRIREVERRRYGRIFVLVQRWRAVRVLLAFVYPLLLRFKASCCVYRHASRSRSVYGLSLVCRPSENSAFIPEPSGFGRRGTHDTNAKNSIAWTSAC